MVLMTLRCSLGACDKVRSQTLWVGAVPLSMCRQEHVFFLGEEQLPQLIWPEVGSWGLSGEGAPATCGLTWRNSPNGRSWLVAFSVSL